MTRLSFLVALLLLCFAANPAQAQKKLKTIFNGKNLKRWVVPENNIWFTVNDGVLKVKNGPNKKGHILWTKKKYKDFVIEADFKMGDGTVDSGFFMRNETDQIQIGISGSLKRDMTCSPYIAKKGYPVEAEGVAELLKLSDWNTIKVQAKGMEYTAWLNGKKVMTYTSPTPYAKGPIGIQLHGNREMQIQFRDIKLAKTK